VGASRRVGGRTIRFSNLDKVLFPAEDLTKSDLIDYYDGVAAAMLPHLRGRPMTLERFPDGVDRHRVYSKDAPGYFPAWIARATVAKKGGTVTHVVCNDRPTLLYLANQATVTPHVALSRVDSLHHPDQVVWDLDPADDDIGTVPWAAQVVRQLLESIGLASFPKSSGSRGIHVVTPLDRSATFEEVRSLARDVAALLAARHPARVTIEHRLGKRGGRLYLDWTRNNYAQTVVAPYAVRARPGAPVALPLAWGEVDEGFRPREFAMAEALRRVEGRVDPWRGWRRRTRSLVRARRRLDALSRTET
jgi:bifunctional non-homologous end joining protein LigD